MVWRHDVYQSSLAVFFCHLQAAGSHAPLASVDLPHIQIRSATIQLVTIHTFIAYKRELDSIYTYIQYIGIYNKEYTACFDSATVYECFSEDDTLFFAFYVVLTLILISS